MIRETDSIQIGIVGAGRVGCSLGKYVSLQGKTVAGYFSKSKESVEEAATFVGTRAFSSLEELVKTCGVLWITTPDDAIASVWEHIRKMPVRNKTICHFSGSLSSVVFSGREEKGITACSVHPMYAFSDKFTSYQQLNSAVFTMEGDAEALALMRPLFEGAGNRVCVIAPEKKMLYHAAAVTASNLMVGLYQMSLDMLADCGFDAGTAEGILRPLIEGNVEKMLATSPAEALTGPLERGDLATVQGHLKVLAPGERDVYVPLSRVLLTVAEARHPETDYSAIREFLGNGD